jgi:hypothetical protein
MATKIRYNYGVILLEFILSVVLWKNSKVLSPSDCHIIEHDSYTVNPGAREESQDERNLVLLRAIEPRALYDKRWN